MENGGMAPLILWEWVVKAAPRPLYFLGNKRGTRVKGRSERVRRGQIPLPPSGFELKPVHYVRVAAPTEQSEPRSLKIKR